MPNCIVCLAEDNQVKDYRQNFGCSCEECRFHEKCYTSNRIYSVNCPICRKPALQIDSGCTILPFYKFACLVSFALELLSIGCSTAVISMGIDSDTTIGMSVGIICAALAQLFFILFFSINLTWFVPIKVYFAFILDMCFAIISLAWAIAYWAANESLSETAKINGLVGFIRVCTVVILTQPVKLFLIVFDENRPLDTGLIQTFL